VKQAEGACGFDLGRAVAPRASRGGGANGRGGEGVPVRQSGEKAKERED